MSSDGCQEVLYKDILFGSNISTLKKKNCKNGNMAHWKEINLCNVSGGYVMILALMSDCISLYPNTIFLDSMLSSKTSVSNMGVTSTSGYVLLACASLKPQDVRESKIWGYNDFVLARSCKPNVIAGSGIHFDSSGFNYSFGNKANFAIINNSSISQYVCKKSTTTSKSNICKLNADRLELSCATELKNGITVLSRIIPRLKVLISPIIKVAYDNQKTHGDINLKLTSTHDVGLWQSAICTNAQTKIFHTEKDCTYTLITVPNQEEKKKN